MRAGGGLADKLRGRLTTLYGPQGSLVADRVVHLIEEYAPRIKPQSKTNWDQQDVILITYPDQVVEAQRPALEVLEEFLVSNGLKNTFRILHILPFFPSSSDDGFSVVDYRQVDPRLGGWHHVESLRQHFDLAIDFVLNHVSRQSRYFKGYLAREEPYVRFFIEISPQPALVQVVRPRNTPLLTPVDTKAGRRYVWTTFSNDQIDLNYTEPLVLLEMLEILLFYLQQGARIIRLDAIPYLWKRLGTSCIHLPETHEVVKLFREIVDAVAPGTLLLAQTNVPAVENVSYFGHGDEAHLVYQFSLPPLLLDAFFSGSGTAVTELLPQISETPLGTTVVNVLATHDGIGLRGAEKLLTPGRIAKLIQAIIDRGGHVTYRLANDGSEVPYELNISYYSALSEPTTQDPNLQLRRFLGAHAFMLALRGLPAVYFPSLFATPNDERRFQATGQPRAIHRPKFIAKELRARLTNPESIEHRALEAMKRLVAVRIAQPAFHPESRQISVQDAPSHLIALERESFDGRQRIMVVLNVGSEVSPIPPQLLKGRKIVRDLLAEWPELSILREDFTTGVRCHSGVTAETPRLLPGGIVWWEVS